MKFSKVRGFTILELVVTISIIGILSTIVLTNMAAASKRGRDVERQSDLRNLQNAVESYKKKNGTYPDMGPNPNGDNWSTEVESPNAYIVGLAPEFIDRLPTDKALGTDNGYSYTVNAVGTVYKLIAWNTVETDSLTDEHPFAVCDSVLCPAPPYNACAAPNPRFLASYGVWGGYAGVDGASSSTVMAATRGIICR